MTDSIQLIDDKHFFPLLICLKNVFKFIDFHKVGIAINTRKFSEINLSIIISEVFNSLLK